MTDATSTTSTQGPRAKRPRKAQARAATWRPLFLEGLRNSGNVRAACHGANIDYGTAYKARERSQEFAAQWDVALEEAADALEAEAWRRALIGVEKPVHYMGKRVDVIKEYSDALLMFLLKAHRPGRFRETVRQEHTGPSGGPVMFRVVYDDGDPKTD